MSIKDALIELHEEALGTPADRGIEKEIYIAIRTDGLEGTGTAEDPLDGSTREKFDAIMSSAMPYTKIVLGNGNFQTHGQAAWQMKEGMHIVGTGISTTKIINQANTYSNRVISSSSNWAGNSHVENITIDCGYDPTATPTNSYLSGIELWGGNITVKNVRITNPYGDQSSGQECFSIGIWAPPYANVEANKIEDCIVDNCKGDYVIGIAYLGQEGRIPKNSRITGNIVLDTPWTAFSATGENIIIDGNTANRCGFFFRFDSASLANSSIFGNDCTYNRSGILFVNQPEIQIKGISIRNNTFISSRNIEGHQSLGFHIAQSSGSTTQIDGISITGNSFLNSNSSPATYASSKAFAVEDAFENIDFSNNFVYQDYLGQFNSPIPTQTIENNWINGSFISNQNISWGSITGTLEDQTDIQEALDEKQNLLPTPSERGIVNNIYISVRTDNKPGTGTEEDPFNGNDQIKFDALINTIAPGTRVNLGAGIFFTRGINLPPSCALYGSGIYITTIKNLANENSKTVIFSEVDCSNSTVSSLTIDCNHINGTTYEGAALAAINLRGSECLIRNVRCINAYGSSFANNECFAIAMEPFDHNYPSSGNRIDSNIVEHTHGDYAMAIALLGPNNNAIISNNTIQDTTWVAISASGENISIENNTATNTGFFFRFDTGKFLNSRLHANTATFTKHGIQFVHQSGYTTKGVTISQNQLYALRSTESFSSVGIFLDHLSGPTSEVSDFFVIENILINNDTSPATNTSFIPFDSDNEFTNVVFDRNIAKCSSLGNLDHFGSNHKIGTNYLNESSIGSIHSARYSIQSPGWKRIIENSTNGVIGGNVFVSIKHSFYPTRLGLTCLFSARGYNSGSPILSTFGDNFVNSIVSQVRVCDNGDSGIALDIKFEDTSPEVTIIYIPNPVSYSFLLKNTESIPTFSGTPTIVNVESGCVNYGNTITSLNISGFNTGDQYGGVTSSTPNTYLRRKADNSGYEFGALPGGGGSSPTTTEGDIIVRGATADERLAVGAPGSTLTVIDSRPTWVRSWRMPLDPSVGATSGSGSASEIFTTSAGAVSGVPGAPVTLSTGTTSLGAANAVFGSSNTNSTRGSFYPADLSELGMAIYVMAPTLSNGTDTFIAYAGYLGNNAANAAPSNAVGLRLEGSSIKAFCVASSTETTLTWSGTVSAGNSYLIAFRWRRADGAVDFWVEDDFVGTISTNIPNPSSVVQKAAVQVRKTAGTNSRTVHFGLPEFTLVK